LGVTVGKSLDSLKATTKEKISESASDAGKRVASLGKSASDAAPNLTFSFGKKSAVNESAANIPSPPSRTWSPPTPHKQESIFSDDDDDNPDAPARPQLRAAKKTVPAAEIKARAATSNVQKKLLFDDDEDDHPLRVESPPIRPSRTVVTKSLFGDDADFDTNILLKSHTGLRTPMSPRPNPNQPLFRHDYPQDDPRFKPELPPGPAPRLKPDESGNIDPLGGLPVIDRPRGGGKRKRTIKRKHRSIRYNTLRSKK
jgi:hypothetical protein